MGGTNTPPPPLPFFSSSPPNPYNPRHLMVDEEDWVAVKGKKEEGGWGGKGTFAW